MDIGFTGSYSTVVAVVALVQLRRYDSPVKAYYHSGSDLGRVWLLKYLDNSHGVRCRTWSLRFNFYDFAASRSLNYRAFTV